MEWNIITVTQPAYEYIYSIIKKNEKNNIGILINIKKSGCAGFKYTFELIYKNSNKNFFSEQKNKKIIIKKINFFIPLKICKIIEGTTIDIVQQGLNKQIKILNPKTQSTCGCGESFEMKL
ncbi:iron-sulfur cluster assembly accessory protein [Buchnera aphidicola (Thelaxes californica)]|uniref:Iron-sulfur cluster assembly accessory protein n=1 Tax=Buchnera aphidicola (Thelaxes californica) TaxID=1315998 RepID=A0A4D6YJJ2_9GAMM|nr:iron-sulfur cluster assembly accessory protein [Buchnera aphidicola]QCI26651.1 iron-sulfur cluster assembly accessory protein [Buchnera aphidicola (Thelaxes californica)]